MPWAIHTVYILSVGNSSPSRYKSKKSQYDIPYLSMASGDTETRNCIILRSSAKFLIYHFRIIGHTLGYPYSIYLVGGKFLPVEI